MNVRGGRDRIPNVAEEKQFLADICNGDRAAMRRLYDRYSKYAMAICLRYVPDTDDVKDVMQDSFVKVFTSIGSFEYRGEGSLKSWIARIVANEALDHVRRKSRYTFTCDVPEYTDEGDPDIDAVDDDTLAAMIGRLPDGYRMVLNMYVFDGMSHREIGSRLGIAEGTSASQFFHAKKLLARMINGYKKERER